jgi:hypothetical protein
LPKADSEDPLFCPDRIGGIGGRGRYALAPVSIGVPLLFKLVFAKAPAAASQGRFHEPRAT